MNRYLVGEHFYRGRRNSCWTSEKPGVTGPWDLEQVHRNQTLPRLVAIALGRSRSIFRRRRSAWVYYWRKTAQ